MAKKFDLKAGGPSIFGKDREFKEYKVAEFPRDFKAEKLVEPAYLYQKGVSGIATGSTAETFRPMNLKYKGCLPTRKKEQEILGKKKDKLPYVLEDSGRKKQAYLGSKRGSEEGSYVMVLMSGNDSMNIFPIKDWYSFSPKITRKVYSFEEAEAEFSRGRGRRGDDSDEDDYESGEEDEDQGDEIDFNEKMSDDEDVLGVGGSDDNEDVANMIQGMEDTKSEEDEDDEENPTPAENPPRDPDEESRLPSEGGEQSGAGDHPPDSEAGQKEGEESKKRAAESPAQGAQEPARKKARMEVGDDDDADGKKWDRMIEEHVKKLLLKKGSMTAQRILKYFKKRHGLDDKKKKARFFKIVSKLATIEECPDGGKVVSLKQIYVPSS